MPTQEEIDLDAPVHPDAAPGLGFGDLIKYAPILEALIQDVEQALAGGTFTAPPIKFKLAGKHVEIDATIKTS